MSHNKIVVDGTYDSTPETFSFSASFASGTDTAVFDDNDLNTWAAACGDWLSGATVQAGYIKSLISAACTIRRVRIYAYPDETGSPAITMGESLEAINGSSTVRQAPQIAACCTLNTGLTGRSRRGRMYLPAIGAPIGSTFKWGGTGVTPLQVAEGVATMLDAFADAGPALSIRPKVHSRALGALTPVRSVSVDDVFDTQRRRRDKLVGTRQSFNVPA